MKHLLFLSLFVAVKSFSAAYDISTLTTPASKYLIASKPITVHSGDTLIVEQGSEVLFTNFSGITVLPGGTFMAAGSKDHPIYFTSLQDTAKSAAAFDWNGIEIKEGAFAQLSYCFIAFSTSGITAEDSTGVHLENCIFSVNGQWNFSVSGIITNVPDLQPFSFIPLKPVAALSAPAVPKDTTPVLIASPPIAQSHSSTNIKAWSLGSAGILLATASAVFFYQSYKFRSDYNSFLPGTAKFDTATPAVRQKHFNQLRQSHFLASTLAWSFCTLAIADGVYLSFSLR